MNDDKVVISLKISFISGKCTAAQLYFAFVFLCFYLHNPGPTRVAVKMLKPHHSGSEHAEADLLSEYNLLKEVRIVKYVFRSIGVCLSI